jgi:hypothetical protein
MPPRDRSARSHSTRSWGDAGAGPSRDHALPADLRAALDAFVELVPRLLRLPGPDGRQLQPLSVTANRRLTARLETFYELLENISSQQFVSVLQYSRVTELSALLLRNPRGSGDPAESEAMEVAEVLLDLLLRRSEQLVPYLAPVALQLIRADVPSWLARSAAAAAEQLGDRSGILGALDLLDSSTVVVGLLAKAACAVPAVAGEVEATFRNSHILQHTSRLMVVLTSATVQLQDALLSSNVFRRLPYHQMCFNEACAHVEARIGATAASRQLLGGWPLMALLAQSTAVLRAVDGGTAYGLPVELCQPAQIAAAQPRAAGRPLDISPSVAAACGSLAYGRVPLQGISRCGALAVVLRAGRLALSAVATCGRITDPSGRSFTLERTGACSLAVEALVAATHLLLPADADAGWVREGRAAVWRLAADMALANALQTQPFAGCVPAAFGTVFMLLEAELLEGEEGRSLCMHVCAPACLLCERGYAAEYAAKLWRVTQARALLLSLQRTSTPLRHRALALRQRWRAAACS